MGVCTSTIIPRCDFVRYSWRDVNNHFPLHLLIGSTLYRPLEEQYGMVSRDSEIPRMENGGLVRLQLSRHEHQY